MSLYLKCFFCKKNIAKNNKLIFVEPKYNGNVISSDLSVSQKLAVKLPKLEGDYCFELIALHKTRMIMQNYILVNIKVLWKIKALDLKKLFYSLKRIL